MNSGLSSDSSQCLGSPYASREPLGIIVAQSPATNLALVLNQFLHGHAQIFEGFRSTHVAVPVGLVEPKLAASSALRTLKSNDYRYFVAGGTCGFSMDMHKSSKDLGPPMLLFQSAWWSPS